MYEPWTKFAQKKPPATQEGEIDCLIFLWVFTHVCAQQLQGFIKQTLIAAEIPATSETNSKDEDDDGDSKLCIIVTAIVGSVTGNYVNPEAVDQND